MRLGFLIALAYLMDECFGEPKQFHPLVGFGTYVKFLESKFYGIEKNKARLFGILAWCMAVLPPVFILFWLMNDVFNEAINTVVSASILYFTIGQKSLKQHGLAVYKPLVEGKIEQARIATSMIVSRDASESNETQLATATVETITENTNDAVIAPIFYFCLFGPLGALLFRLANTLDAMWGYRNEKYENFGKFSARMDDALGYIPARITVLLFVIVKPFRFRKILNSVWHQGTKWYSPNAGIVMAAGAAALDTKLGGSAVYHGKTKQRLILGEGTSPDSAKIKSSISLMYKASLAFLMLVLLAEWSELQMFFIGILP